MQLARVCGQVISTKKAEKLMGFKILVCQPIDMVTFKEKGAPFVSIDSVGAGDGELVMCVSGSSSRQTSVTDAKPVDNCIVAIIDSVDILGERCFDKADPSVTPAAAKEEKKPEEKKQSQKSENNQKPDAENDQAANLSERPQDAELEELKEESDMKQDNEDKNIGEAKRDDIRSERNKAKSEENKPELLMTNTKPKPQKLASESLPKKAKTKEEQEAQKIIEDIMKKLENTQAKPDDKPFKSVKENDAIENAKGTPNSPANKKPNHSAQAKTKNTKAAVKPNKK